MSLLWVAVILNFVHLISGVGWGMIIVTHIGVLYYNTIMVWTVYFLGMSFQNPLPWTRCDNDWNTPNCRGRDNLTNWNVTGYGETGDYQVALDENSTMQLDLNVTLVQRWSSPTEEFFK